MPPFPVKALSIATVISLMIHGLPRDPASLVLTSSITRSTVFNVQVLAPDSGTALDVQLEGEAKQRLLNLVSLSRWMTPKGVASLPHWPEPFASAQERLDQAITGQGEWSLKPLRSWTKHGRPTGGVPVHFLGEPSVTVWLETPSEDLPFLRMMNGPNWPDQVTGIVAFHLDAEGEINMHRPPAGWLLIRIEEDQEVLRFRFPDGSYKEEHIPRRRIIALGEVESYLWWVTAMRMPRTMQSPDGMSRWDPAEVQGLAHYLRRLGYETNELPNGDNPTHGMSYGLANHKFHLPQEHADSQTPTGIRVFRDRIFAPSIYLMSPVEQQPEWTTEPFVILHSDSDDPGTPIVAIDEDGMGESLSSEISPMTDRGQVQLLHSTIARRFFSKLSKLFIGKRLARTTNSIGIGDRLSFTLYPTEALTAIRRGMEVATHDVQNRVYIVEEGDSIVQHLLKEGSEGTSEGTDLWKRWETHPTRVSAVQMEELASRALIEMSIPYPPDLAHRLDVEVYLKGSKKPAFVVRSYAPPAVPPLTNVNISLHGLLYILEALQQKHPMNFSISAKFLEHFKEPRWTARRTDYSIVLWKDPTRPVMVLRSEDLQKLNEPGIDTILSSLEVTKHYATRMEVVPSRPFSTLADSVKTAEQWVLGWLTNGQGDGLPLLPLAPRSKSGQEYGAIALAAAVGVYNYYFLPATIAQQTRLLTLPKKWGVMAAALLMGSSSNPGPKAALLFYQLGEEMRIRFLDSHGVQVEEILPFSHKKGTTLIWLRGSRAYKQFSEAA